MTFVKKIFDVIYTCGRGGGEEGRGVWEVKTNFVLRVSSVHRGKVGKLLSSSPRGKSKI